MMRRVAQGGSHISRILTSCTRSESNLDQRSLGNFGILGKQMGVVVQPWGIEAGVHTYLYALPWPDSVLVILATERVASHRQRQGHL